MFRAKRHELCHRKVSCTCMGGLRLVIPVSTDSLSPGVEMISADVNNVESLKAAVFGCYGVFGVTNYWDRDVLDKAKEEQQGTNIFEACKSQGVTHLVWSALPYAAQLTGGRLQHVSHFDFKAIVAEKIENMKGQMICSYYMPGEQTLTTKSAGTNYLLTAMYIDALKGFMRVIDGELCLMMPYGKTNKFMWPLTHARTDGGKYIMGLFEAASAADGMQVHAVSCWATVDEVLRALSIACARDVIFKEVTVEAHQALFPEITALDMTQTMLLVGNYSYYGPGEEQKQAAHDRWMVQGSHRSSLEAIVQAAAPWSFGQAS